MFTSSSLKHYREVGFVIVVHPPVTPAKSVNTHELHNALNELVQSGTHQIVLDCAGIEYFYSDTLNVIAQTFAKLKQSSALFGVLHASPAIEKMIETAFNEQVLCFNGEPEILSWSMRNPPQIEVEESWVDSPKELVENLEEDPNDFEIEQEILDSVPQAESVPVARNDSKPLVQSEAESDTETAHLSPMEKAALAAQEKLALRKQKELAEAKQKKRKLIAIGVLLLLSLTAGLYLWQKASIDQWLNEFISRLF